MTEITAPAGFFINDAVTPITATDLEAAVASALANISAAVTAETAAAASATAAASSATTASGAQSAAATSETNAAASATTATSQATAAAGSATTATTQASAASTSATAASASAGSAASSATAANSSATSASNSATAAATSATGAAASATAAAASAASVAALSNNTPVMDGTATAGVGTTASRADHVHPRDTSLLGVGRNWLHNSLFNIAQRGTGAFTSAGYTLDRWAVSKNTDTISISSHTLADTDRTQIGDEAATSSFLNTFAGDAGAGSFNYAYQRIEQVRRLSGKTVTVSFYAVANSGTPKVGASINQNFGTGGSPSSQVNGSGTAVTLSTAWGRYQVTLAIPSISGKTLGSNGDDFTELDLWFSSGSTNASRSGTVGVQTNDIQLWGVQLEVGIAATPLEKQDPQMDLANCQRFYTVSRIVTAGMGNSAAAVISLASLPTPMRAAPTAGATNNSATNTGAVTLLTGAGAVWASFTPPSTSGFLYDATITASADL